MIRSTANNQTGFTIIELVVIVTIIAIMAVFINFNPGSLLSIERVAQEFAADVKYTQNLAMTRGQIFYLSIDTSNTYSIRNAAGVAQQQPYTKGTTITLANKLTMSPINNLPNNVIVFNSRGTPYTNTSGTTALTTSASVCFQQGGESMCAIISPTTGYVKLP